MSSATPSRRSSVDSNVPSPSRIYAVAGAGAAVTVAILEVVEAAVEKVKVGVEDVPAPFVIGHHDALTCEAALLLGRGPRVGRTDLAGGDVERRGANGRDHGVDPQDAWDGRHARQVRLPDVDRDHPTHHREAAHGQLDRLRARPLDRPKIRRSNPLDEADGGAHRARSARREEARRDVSGSGGSDDGQNEQSGEWAHLRIVGGRGGATAPGDRRSRAAGGAA